MSGIVDLSVKKLGAMVDPSHDSLGPASPKPGDAAQQQASRLDSTDKGKLRVFISYSREDLKFADQLDAALSAYGFECLIDRHRISGGEDWKQRLGNLISEADTVVFVLSPSSACSKICDWEVEEAARLNKRILPVNCRPLDGVSPSPRLRELNYIFFYEEPKLTGSGFGSGLANLVTALNTDFDWLREHTRYLQRAIEWDSGGRPSNRLLSGDDIRAAKAWLARRPKSAPEPTALHLDFIRASEEEAAARLSEQRKQLEEMAAAQDEREKALHIAEEARRKRVAMARIRNIALVAVSILALLAGWFGWRAEQQRRVAEEQTEQVNQILESATQIINKTFDQIDITTRKEAFAVFRTGANRGDASSMVNLANLYLNGWGVAQDYGKAREWYEKAADKGLWAGMFNLGALYENGQGVAQDYTKAREWYEKAADKDTVGASMTNLGLLYENGQGVAQDYAKAREWYEKAADKGSDFAMFNLGVLYHNGSGVAQDYTKAREWYEKAAAKGNENAMAELGHLYGGEQDYVKAREWLQKAADKGNADAMAGLGVLYENGDGVAQDYAKAREWVEKAANKGNPFAMFNLGAFYRYGFGVAQDYAKAREWYEKAAAKGNATAMNSLGEVYANGYGVTQDYAKAREWYEKAAAIGNAEAKAHLKKLGTR